MAHRYRIREIAMQAGLSEATVDRVLNERGGVRPSTAEEVHRAITDLDRQRTQLRIGGRTFMVDVVMQAPKRFSSAVRSHLEAELPFLQPVVVRSRFHFRESGQVDDLVAILDRIARRGSHGVILKAPDVVDVHDAVARLMTRGIPVVTLVTDLPSSERVAYVGMDNHAAGATAAYLITQWLGASAGDVLVTLSSGSFRGEEERMAGFHAAMRSTQPERTLVEITESGGLDAPMRELVLDALAGHVNVNAVYSIGGGNRAILDAFDKLGRRCTVFVAHDLDQDNRLLLGARRISTVLHHDLGQDMHRACHLIMRWHKALPGAIGSIPASIQVITPSNMPATGART